MIGQCISLIYHLSCLLDANNVHWTQFFLHLENTRVTGSTINFSPLPVTSVRRLLASLLPSRHHGEKHPCLSKVLLLLLHHGGHFVRVGKTVSVLSKFSHQHNENDTFQWKSHGQSVGPTRSSIRILQFLFSMPNSCSQRMMFTSKSYVQCVCNTIHLGDVTNSRVHCIYRSERVVKF